MDEFHPICEVQSDKASVVITSRYKGKVSMLTWMPGDIIKVMRYTLIVLDPTLLAPLVCKCTS